MTEFFDYAEHNSFTLFPCAAGTKRPILPWKKESSFDRKQWVRWSVEGHNLAIDCAKSGLIVVDVDCSKVTPEEASAAYHDLCQSWGLPSGPAVMTQSARGGWHVPFERPGHLAATDLRGGGTLVKISDVRTLSEGELDGEVIGFKNRGYCVAPGSRFDGKPYLLMPDAPDPHQCPAGLVDLIRLPVVEAQASGPTGISEPTDVARLVAFLDSHGEFDAEPDWFNALGAIKLACGDTEQGLLVARQITREDATEEAFLSRWNRLVSDAAARPGVKLYTIGSMIKRAEALGQKFRVGKSAVAMFQGVADRLSTGAGMPSVPAGPANAVSMMSGGANWQPTTAPPEYSEIEVADRFANGYATNLRYIKARGSWIYWDGKRWNVDNTDHVANLARLHCKTEAGICAGTPGNTNAQARALCSDKTVRAVLRLAAVDPRIASTVSAWDQDPWLLGTPDGIVDLRDGTFRPAIPEDHVTKSTAVSPNGDCPTWLAFLQRATGGDVDLQKYLQRLCGYALTGSIREQSLYFVSGPGAGGKGTLMHAVSSILHDYHVVTAIATLTDTKFDRHPAEIAALQGARLVTCSETERGRNWAESRIKEWTGGDPISARFMNQNFFTFTPTFKLLISGNYKPHMRPDTAMRRRFQLIPFKTAIPKSEQDPKLGAKLEKEWPGILGWMIAGTVEWQRVGLSPPSAVLDATNEYMEEEAEDVLSAWMHDRCELDPKAETVIGELYRSYKIYAEQAGESVMTNAMLGKELKRLEFQSRRTERARLVVGLKLAPPAEPPGHPASFPRISSLPPLPY
jgi:putative DNA primase/helicase